MKYIIAFVVIAPCIHPALADTINEAPRIVEMAPETINGDTRNQVRQQIASLVKQCWLFNPNSPHGKISVTVAFTIGLDGMPVSQPELVRHSEGSSQVVQAAFEFARRAVLRCFNEFGGLDTMPNDGEHTRVEINFNATVGEVQ